jgi:hypothetical protein
MTANPTKTRTLEEKLAMPGRPKLVRCHATAGCDVTFWTDTGELYCPAHANEDDLPKWISMPKDYAGEMKKRVETLQALDDAAERSRKMGTKVGGCQGPHGFEAISTREGIVAAVLEEQKEVRHFDTGATRDTDAGKYAYEGFICPFVLTRFAEYMNKHRVQSDGSLRAADNWQKGIPVEAYKDSLVRHVIDAWRVFRGETPKPRKELDPQDLEELLCAIMFNSMGLLHEILKEKRQRETL